LEAVGIPSATELRDSCSRRLCRPGSNRSTYPLATLKRPKSQGVFRLQKSYPHFCLEHSFLYNKKRECRPLRKYPLPHLRTEARGDAPLEPPHRNFLVLNKRSAGRLRTGGRGDSESLYTFLSYKKPSVINRRPTTNTLYCKINYI